MDRQKEEEKRTGHSMPFLLIAIVSLVLSSVGSVDALNVGILSENSGGLEASKRQECSRTCESDHCSVPPLLRYGKYCGIMYSGCPGEKPCDGLDACCMRHDACVSAKNNDYLSIECNSKLLDCLATYKDSEGPTFQGNTCIMRDVVDVISVVIEAAVLAGRFLHKP
ncbi:phospholipase A2-alpha [Iris pallida]|uniref:phospholipase A2 n=1 Tax=Iris pallida TaxID=29817 RepID=A0AAX6EN51_IRIPA|nr:phospholipase A2-alpha [Iris pallida]